MDEIWALLTAAAATQWFLLTIAAAAFGVRRWRWRTPGGRRVAAASAAGLAAVAVFAAACVVFTTETLDPDAFGPNGTATFRVMAALYLLQWGLTIGAVVAVWRAKDRPGDRTGDRPGADG